MSRLTIGQLARRVGMRTSALRYYEEQGLLTPVARTEAGYRLYDPAIEQTVRFIQRARHLGFSLADIRTLLSGWEQNNLNDTTITATAEARYLALERQVTQLLVLQHELGLFLQDLYQKTARPPEPVAELALPGLLEHVCTNPINQPATAMFDWLLERTGCVLTTSEAWPWLNTLRGQHVHIWSTENGYAILVVSDDPDVGQSLAALAQLESHCQTHAHGHQFPQLCHNDEGYLLTVQGDHAFLFARLFLALEQETRSG